MASDRDDWLVATKVRMPMGDLPNDAGLSRHHLVRAVEASLRRLRTDHVDLYQMHEWDGVTPLEETWGALDTLVQSGKVRYLGISNYPGWQTAKTVEVARCASGALSPVDCSRANTDAVTRSRRELADSKDGRNLPSSMRNSSTTSLSFSLTLEATMESRPRRWHLHGRSGGRA